MYTVELNFCYYMPIYMLVSCIFSPGMELGFFWGRAHNGQVSSVCWNWSAEPHVKVEDWGGFKCPYHPIIYPGFSPPGIFPYTISVIFRLFFKFVFAYLIWMKIQGEPRVPRHLLVLKLRGKIKYPNAPASKRVGCVFVPESGKEYSELPISWLKFWKWPCSTDR